MQSIFQVIRSKIIQMPQEPYAFEAMIRTKAGTAQYGCYLVIILSCFYNHNIQVSLYLSSTSIPYLYFSGTFGSSYGP